MTLGYRARQFWNTLTATPPKDEAKNAKALLTPKQVLLFEQMSPAEQVHAIRVMNWLRQRGENHPDLLVSALLHDVGKARYPKSTLERSIAVIFNRIRPTQAEGWSTREIELGTWKGLLFKPFIVAKQHPSWSAEMVAQSGSSQRVVYLVLNHQNYQVSEIVSIMDAILIKLQTADKNN